MKFYRRYLLKLLVFGICFLSSGCSSSEERAMLPTPTSTSTSTPTPTATQPHHAPSACAVYGQADFTTAIHAQDTINQDTLSNPGAIRASADGGFYVVDYSNNRVLHFPPTTGRGVGPQADRVYGQPDFFSHTTAKGRMGLNSPHGVVEAPDGSLYIADMLNDRVLHYPTGSTSADLVYGQPDFTANGINSGGLSAASLFHPQGITLDHTGLYVADAANNRIVHYPTGSTTADMVYGQGLPGNAQANFTRNSSSYGTIGLNNPRDIAVNSTGLYVADASNNRVLHYMPGNPQADFVYGQPDFLSTSTLANQGRSQPDASTLNNPTGLDVDRQNRLIIADRNNNRVLFYPSLSQTPQNGPAARQVYGQIGYNTGTSSTSASTFNGPGAVAIDRAGNVLVLDIFNQRVLKFCADDTKGM